MYRIKEHTTYKLKQEFFKIYNINTNTWDRYKEDLLEWFEQYFTFKIYTGARRTLYIAIEKIYDKDIIYEQMPDNKKVSKERKENFYEAQTILHIHEQPQNTAINIARALEDSDEVKEFHHKTTTSAKYIGHTLKNTDIMQIIAKDWVKLKNGIYYDLTPQQLDYLTELFKENMQNDDTCDAIIDTLAQEDNGDITKDETDKQIANTFRTIYKNVIADFKHKYGFRPFQVPIYGLNMFNEKVQQILKEATDTE